MVTSPNRFDFLRLLFAGLVFAYHAVALPNIDMEQAVEPILAQVAQLSIQGFFVISGALVYGSWTRSTGISDYASKRARRLYPAYFVVILVSALVSLVLSGGYLDVARYLAANLTFLNFLEPSLPGLFEGQRFPVVNGALWTLKIEVMFYLVLPLIAFLLARAGRLKWTLLAALYSSAEIWRAGVPHLDIPHALDFARQLPGQMSFFAAGMGLWLVWVDARARPLHFGFAGAILLALSFVPGMEPFRATGLAGVIACLAFMPGPKLDAARWGDISYGVYITHFPIVNALVMLGVFAASPVLGFVLSAALVITVSLLLWRFVERPFLKRSSHYRQGEAS